MLKKFMLRMYNQRFEDISVRVIYFFNTIDTYFLAAGIISLWLFSSWYGLRFSQLTFMLVCAGGVYALFKLADFYPLFVICSPVYLYFLLKNSVISFPQTGILLLINLCIFTVIQFIFMSIPESVVARDMSIGFRKIWNSVFTIAPTTVSMSMSVFYSSLFALVLLVKPMPDNTYGLLFWISMGISAGVACWGKPRSFISVFHQPEHKEKICEKLVILNIDGCRLDRFYEAELPFMTSLLQESSYFPNGLYTVYRALTNPAFASILTGTIPSVHGVKTNNLSRQIRVEGLPDIVPTKLYGSMHVKHFSKNTWDTQIVSLPEHGSNKCDDVMFDMLVKDLAQHDGTRLYVADISETDFLGHAYGSQSRQYLDALKRADARIEKFMAWLRMQPFVNDMVVIICSDHGIVQIDHSYLLFDAEKRVPFMVVGKGIKKNNKLMFEASIMDIAPTVSYLLGIRYPSSSKGRVLTEIFE
ncbi:MAG: alkaline phosphatase family protein [bacterium]